MRIPSTNPQAVACVRGGMGAPKLKGTVRFYAIPGGTLVTAEVSGLPENDTGFFAFHSPPGVLFTFPSQYYTLSVTG